MNFTLKTLSLYKDLVFTQCENKDTVKTELLWTYINGIEKNNLEPKREKFLLHKNFVGYAIKNQEVIDTKNYHAIAAGKYAFLQGTMSSNECENEDIFNHGAEELYLESLWLEQEFENDIVFLRVLTEDSRKVFQLFRKLKNA